MKFHAKEVEALEQVRKANGGLLLAEKVFAAAKAKDSPLHKYFEWDREVAWRKHNLEVAGQLIRSYTIHYTQVETKPRKAKVSEEIGKIAGKVKRTVIERYTPSPTEPKGYRPTLDLLAGKECKGTLLQEHDRAYNQYHRYQAYLTAAGKDEERSMLDQAWNAVRLRLEGIADNEVGG